jgi:hypothetical protein
MERGKGRVAIGGDTSPADVIADLPGWVWRERELSVTKTVFLEEHHSMSVRETLRRGYQTSAGPPVKALLETLRHFTGREQFAFSCPHTKPPITCKI